MKIMRIFSILLMSLLFAMLCGSCSKDSYADSLEAQEDAITSFISKNNISVKESMMDSDGEWMDGKKEVYYKYNSGKSDGLYYHQCEKGDGAEPKEDWRAYVRYVGYSLQGEMVYNTTVEVSPDPESFIVMKSPKNCSYGIGFQQAVKNLRVGGHCKVIIPFTIGNESLITYKGGLSSDRNNTIPMYYEIWLVGLE